MYLFDGDTDDILMYNKPYGTNFLAKWRDCFRLLFSLCSSERDRANKRCDGSSSFLSFCIVASIFFLGVVLVVRITILSVVFFM